MISKRMPRLGDRFFGDIAGYDDRAARWFPPGEAKMYVKMITSDWVTLAVKRSRPQHAWWAPEHLWGSRYSIKRSRLEWRAEYKFWTIRYKHTSRDRLKWLWHQVRTKRRRMVE